MGGTAYHRICNLRDSLERNVTAQNTAVVIVLLEIVVYAIDNLFKNKKPKNFWLNIGLYAKFGIFVFRKLT